MAFGKKFVSNVVFLTRPILQILGNSDRDISHFWISGQSLIKANCNNSRPCDDIETWTNNLTWQEKQNTVKKFGDDVMSENCNVVAIFPIYGQFGAIRKPNSGRIFCKTYIFIYSNYTLKVTEHFYLTKTENRTKISLKQLSHYCLE